MQASDRLIRGLLALALVCAGCASPFRKPLPEPGSAEHEAFLSAFWIGMSAMQVDDKPHAEPALVGACDLAPGEPAAWANRGLFELRRDQFDDAERNLDRAAELAPESGAIEELRGLAKDRRGQIDAAIAHFTRAVELDPANLRARWQLAKLLERRGGAGLDAAVRAHLDAMLKVAPDNLALMVERVRVLSKVGDRAALDAGVAELAKLAPGWHADARDQIAEIRVAAAAGKPADVLFLQQVLMTHHPTYQEGIAKLQLPGGAIGQEFGRPLRVAVPGPRFAEADAGLTFATGAPGASCDAVAVDWPESGSKLAEGGKLTASGKPAVRAVDAGALIGTSHAFPGGGAAFSPDGLVAGDLDYDFRPDLVLAGAKGARILLAQAAGGWKDGAMIAGDFRGAWLADVDLDGDLDVVLAARAGPVAVQQNDGKGALTPLAAHPFAAVVSARGFAWADLDREGTPDAAFVDGEGKLRVLHSERGGKFRAAELPAAAMPLRVAAVTAADVDGDGSVDLAVIDAAGAIRRATWGAAGWDVKPVGEGPKDAVRILAADLDLNGVADLAASSGAETRVLLGTGSAWTSGPNLAGFTALAAADTDGDGHLDLIGTAAGKLATAVGRGTKGYHWQQIRVRGAATAEGDKRINPHGAGGEIELRAGFSVQKVVIEGPVVHFGLGPRTASDVARFVWPNGSSQSEFDLPLDLATAAVQRLKGSCPFVFAWDGAKMAFVTDFLWRSPLGLKINAVDTAGVAQTEDRVLIRGDQLAPRDGLLDVRITAELWETHFFDHVALIAVDHPDGTVVLVDERFQPARAPSLEARLLTPPRAAAWAKDDGGRDVTATVAARDGRYLDGFGRGEYQGVTREHWVELPRPPGASWLVARGWIHPTDSSLNVAIAQGGRVRPQGLSLDARTGDGAWTMVNGELGFPAGKHKTILVPLAGAAGDRVRLRTNLEIYWDELAFASDAAGEKRERRLELTRADLRHRGFSTIASADASSPELPDYHRLAGTQPRWRDLEGFHTRFGDVRELLAGVDDRYAILNAGDELALAFAPGDAPPAGSVRDHVLVGDGWEKDGDYNTAFSRTVLPLPSHADPAYTRTPGRLADEPVHARHAADWRTYHTRYVTPRWFARGLFQETR